MNDELPIHNNYNRHESFHEPIKLTNGRRLKKRSLKLNKKSILDFQSSEFNFEVVPKLLNFIEELPEPAENTDMMKLSLSKEKKSK